MKAGEFRQKVRNHEVVLGYQQFVPSPTITEIAGLAGFDFAWLCIEHGSAGLGTDLENMIRACNATDMVPLVRITDVEHYIIQKSLEMGAKGLIIPRARTAEDVGRAIEATRFHNGGTRGYCPVSRAFLYGAEPVPTEVMDDEVTIIVLVETKELYDDLDAVLSMPEVDAAFFGSADLSVSLGFKERNAESRRIVEEYRQRLIAACRRHGVAIGQIPSTPERAAELIDEGFTVLGTSPDTGWIYRFFKGYTDPIKEYSRSRTKVLASAS